MCCRSSWSITQLCFIFIIRIHLCPLLKLGEGYYFDLQRDNELNTITIDMWAMRRSWNGWECLCFLYLLLITFCKSGKPEDLTGSPSCLASAHWQWSDSITLFLTSLAKFECVVAGSLWPLVVTGLETVTPASKWRLPCCLVLLGCSFLTVTLPHVSTFYVY